MKNIIFFTSSIFFNENIPFENYINNFISIPLTLILYPFYPKDNLTNLLDLQEISINLLIEIINKSILKFPKILSFLLEKFYEILTNKNSKLLEINGSILTLIKLNENIFLNIIFLIINKIYLKILNNLNEFDELISLKIKKNVFNLINKKIKYLLINENINNNIKNYYNELLLKWEI